MRLLHDVLTETKKAGIAKVVIRTRQHLAAVKVQRQALVLEIMHFADELVEVQELSIPVSKAGTKPREINMAKALVEQMTEKWDPKRYTDDYSSALMSLIKDKIAHGDKTTTAPRKLPKETKVIDLAAVLQGKPLASCFGEQAQTIEEKLPRVVRVRKRRRNFDSS